MTNPPASPAAAAVPPNPAGEEPGFDLMTPEAFAKLPRAKQEGIVQSIHAGMLRNSADPIMQALSAHLARLPQGSDMMQALGDVVAVVMHRDDVIVHEEVRRALAAAGRQVSVFVAGRAEFAEALRTTVFRRFPLPADAPPGSQELWVSLPHGDSERVADAQAKRLRRGVKRIGAASPVATAAQPQSPDSRGAGEIIRPYAQVAEVIAQPPQPGHLFALVFAGRRCSYYQLAVEQDSAAEAAAADAQDAVAGGE